MSKSNPFNLPPPWNAGYALPQNVIDEGIERHAFTTRWAPRGSFDNPEVGTAGYAVPEYIKEEGYGRGAFTTRWAPRGSYFGPKVPHWLDRPAAQVVGRKRMPDGATQLKIQTMAGVEQAVGGPGFAPITAYGLRAARALIDTVRMMPPDLRSQQLKLALDKIDPNLWAKAEAGADAEAKLGVPADIALERGLGAAMSYGLSAELVALAKGKQPAQRSQLGGCLPCAAAMLGAIGDTRPGYCWIPATAAAPGHWERIRAGQDPATCIQVEGGTVKVRTQGGGGVSITDASGNVVQPIRATAPPARSSQAFVNIGPFLIPVNVGAYHDHRTLTGEKRQYVEENVAIAAKAGGISVAEMKTGKYPFVRFKAGGTGQESWGLYYQEEADGKTIVSYHKIPDEQIAAMGGILGDIGGAIKDVAKKVGGAVWDVLKKIWKGIKWVTMKVVHFIVDAAKWIATQTCKLVSTPGVVQGAQAVATVAPNPYTVGVAAGATITKMICDAASSSDDATAAAQAEAEAAEAAAAAAAAQAEAAAAAAKAQGKTASSSMLPVLLIGGAGVAAYLLLGKKK